MLTADEIMKVNGILGSYLVVHVASSGKYATTQERTERLVSLLSTASQNVKAPFFGTAINCCSEGHLAELAQRIESHAHLRATGLLSRQV